MSDRVGFEIAPIQERGDLTLAGMDASANQIWTPGSTAYAAERAAQVAGLVLGVDQKEAQDAFTGQLEAMDLSQIPEGVAPIVSVNVGASGANGQPITPSHVVKGHDALTTKDGSSIPETYVWEKMYVDRPAVWWNKTRPDGTSELVQAPLQLVLADTALRGTSKKWDKQQDELTKLIENHSSDTTTMEGMKPLDWMMMDADAIVNGTDRPDVQTATRFVQHDRDRSDDVDSFGPHACVAGGRAYLHWSDGEADSISRFRAVSGFRAVMGQKQKTA